MSYQVKTQFMTLWDGLETADHDPTVNRIVIIGATNRAHDLDAAILRRMPTRYHVPLPTLTQRIKIFELILHDEILDADVNLEQLASETANCTGSDINEICRQAAMQRIVELCHQSVITNVATNENNDDDMLLSSMRSISQADFLVALREVRDTHQHLQSFNRLTLD
jgi:ATPase family AAA domain-containing protein 1